MNRLRGLSRCDRLALLLAVLCVLLTAWLANRVFENLPHLEDEMAYVWQAQALAGGNIKLASPPCPDCFLVPFIVDYGGARFGKYPLGYPALLAVATKLGGRDALNPLLAGFGLWLTYLLIKKVADEKTALLGAGLMLISPFFLLNSASLLSHAWTLVLTLGLTLGWLDAFGPPGRLPRWLPTLTAALCLAGLALTRPLTAVGVGLPFIIHALYLLWRGNSAERRQVLGIGALAGGLALIHFAWQYAVTGQWLLNPYTLWWPYDTIGFGPDVGLQVGGYALRHAEYNALFSLSVGTHDLFGWPFVSWLFMPFGLIALWRQRRARLVISVFPALVLTYCFYWVGSWLYGPRYYYEALPAVVLLSAAGMRWVAGVWQVSAPRARVALRRRAVTVLVLLLVAGNLVFYLPIRLGGMTGLYSVNRAALTPFISGSLRQLSPGLVIVHTQTNWIEYGRLLELSSPYLDTPFIFTYSFDAQQDAGLGQYFPGRYVWHYYPDEPDRFYITPR